MADEKKRDDADTNEGTTFESSDGGPCKHCGVALGHHEHMTAKCPPHKYLKSAPDDDVERGEYGVILGPRPVPQNASDGPGVFPPWRVCACGVVAPTAPCYRCAHPEPLSDEARVRVEALARQLPGNSVIVHQARTARVQQPSSGSSRMVLAVAFVVVAMWGAAAYVFEQHPRPVDQQTFRAD